jgi:uncharacterized protein YbgA (DUF1722 family)/uncharacterized protein YbbK (DUF523 family)
MSTIRLGISACLLGEPVRYDGGHKRDRFITDTLGPYVEFVPVCPETECGLGVPRESMRLEGDPAAPRLITSRTRVDHTDRMVAWAQKRLKELEKEDLCGFIFKSDSPSSGMERVRVYGDKGMPLRKGIGIFARVFMERFPLVPVEDEGRLHDPKLRENFVESIFALERWRNLLKEPPTRGNLVAFHTEHKLLLLSHSPKHSQLMGKLVAEAKQVPPAELYRQYETLFVAALGVKTTVKKHGNVLQHMMGYFKKELSADEKQELLEVLNDYHEGLTPLIVPITLLKHYVRKQDQSYLKGQVYLNPHPLELKLRNHV